ncbi:MAG: DUF368 domain-containing protein [Venatoribacter sp.]
MSSILLFLKGFLMGAVELIPGVSAGTIAFVTGIYTDLLDSIKSINLNALKTLKNEGIKAAWRAINGNFLLILGSGMLIALLSLSRLIQFLLTHYPVYCWSFFFGLIIAASIYIAREVKWNAVRALLLLIGIACMAYIFTTSAFALAPTPFNLVLAGSVAISAMLLPGISGSFMLVLMGLYAPILQALNEGAVSLLGYFVLGIGAGLLLFTRLLSWLMHHYAQAMSALLTGVMLGSLIKIWPWKQTLEGNYLPSVSSELLGACVLMLIGASTVFVVEWLANQLSKKNNN